MAKFLRYVVIPPHIDRPAPPSRPQPQADRPPGRGPCARRLPTDHSIRPLGYRRGRSRRHEYCRPAGLQGRGWHFPARHFGFIYWLRRDLNTSQEPAGGSVAFAAICSDSAHIHVRRRTSPNSEGPSICGLIRPRHRRRPRRVPPAS